MTTGTSSGPIVDASVNNPESPEAVYIPANDPHGFKDKQRKKTMSKTVKLLGNGDLKSAATAVAQILSESTDAKLGGQDLRDRTKTINRLNECKQAKNRFKAMLAKKRQPAQSVASPVNPQPDEGQNDQMLVEARVKRRQLIVESIKKQSGKIARRKAIVESIKKHRQSAASPKATREERLNEARAKISAFRQKRLAESGTGRTFEAEAKLLGEAIKKSRAGK